MINPRRARELDVKNEKNPMTKMEMLIKLLESGSSEGNPSVSSVSNPCGSSVSNPSRSSVSNPSGPSTSKNLRAEYMNLTRIYQSVKENVSADGEDVALKLKERLDAKGHETMTKMLEDNLRPSVSSPSGSSIHHPSGSSVSSPSRSSISSPSGSSIPHPLGSSVSIPPRPSASSPSVSLVSNPSASLVSIPSRSSVSNPSGPLTSKKLRSEITDRNHFNQRVEENVSEDGENVALKSSDRLDGMKNRFQARAREAMIKMAEETFGPSVFSPSGSSISNTSGSSVSKPPRPSASSPSVSLVSNPSASLVSIPSRSSVSNPSGPLTSKKLRSEITDRNHFNQPVEESVSEDGENVALKSSDRLDEMKKRFHARAREVIIKIAEDILGPSVFSPSGSSISNTSGSSVSISPRPSVSSPSVSFVTNPSVSSVPKRSRTSVSNPSKPSTSKKFKAENTDPTRYNQSVEENVSEVGEDVALKLKDRYDARERKAMIKMPEDNLIPSVSNPSGSSISNPSASSVSNPSRSSEVKEDITEDEETNRELVEFNSSDDDEWVPIGSGKTLVHRDQYRKVNWRSYTIATRTLLVAVFPRRVLATHSLTGKKSPAFQDKPAKLCLDPTKIADIIWTIMDKFNVERSLVRNIITIKCADECKMWKARCRNNKNVPLT